MISPVTTISIKIELDKLSDKEAYKYSQELLLYVDKIRTEYSNKLTYRRMYKK